MTDGIDCHIEMIDSDVKAAEALSYFGVEAVVGQDIHWHFPFLVNNFPTFSIGMFFDTLHYAASHKGGKHRIPTVTYLADDFFSDRFRGLMDRPWTTRVVGSPTFDHSLFVDRSAYVEGSVLFLTPPQSSLSSEMIGQVNELIDFCYKWNKPFIIKDRPKTPWTASDCSKVIPVNYESGFPYTSLTLLMNTSVHVTAYGTSVLESNFLGLPAINLPAGPGGGGRNHDIPGYDSDSIYDNGLCVLTSGHLVDDYHAAIIRPKRAALRQLTMADNHSIDILKDVLNTLDSAG